jgi:putative tryptophan/tyrosine transport system substrate-binding protein
VKGFANPGFVDGQNVRIEERYAGNRRDRLPDLVRELMDHKVTLIATDQSVHAVKAASSTVPTVFVLGADPVGLGLVQSLNRPGGTITGIVFFSARFSVRSCLAHQASVFSLFQAVRRTEPSWRG